MKILVTGSSGFVGKAISDRLRSLGHHVIPLKRDLSNFESADAIIHLGGEPIADEYWSSEKKKRIVESRVVALKRLSSAIQSVSESRPSVLISASAVGYYGDRGNEILTEDSPPGTDFLAEVCKQWEQPIVNRMFGPVRQVSIRMGAVLGDGGVLEKLTPIFRAGLGGPLGTGKQWMSWIDIHDLAAMIEFILNSSEISGVINAVAPHPVTNEQFSIALAAALGKKARWRIPGFLLKFLLGERAQLFLSSQRVEPTRILKVGFKYRYPTIEEALQELSSKARH